MPGVVEPDLADLVGVEQTRIISSRFPPIALFESLVDPDELEIAYAIESLTNDRLQAEAGNLHLVDKDEWVTGAGASVVMAAFTHIGQTSRFSDGSYGTYYAALDIDTALAETMFHQERRLRETSEPPIELDMRAYLGTIAQPLDDVRGADYASLHDPELTSWPKCQHFAAQRRSAGSYGLAYMSARREGGECIAVFRPHGVSLPQQGQHLRYCWNGERIERILYVTEVLVIE